jgi:tRNA-dihydrouridine synthase B
MDGISAYPFRSLTRGLGSAMSYTEFIPALDAVHLASRLKEHIYYTEEERPVVFQLLDNDPDRLVKAAQNLLQFKPDIIDINLGCPAKDIVTRGAGAGLLRTPQKIAAIFARLTQSLPIPVTAKIRLGWDQNNLNYLETARAIEENGGALIAVHGRTQKQGYTGQADWDAIAQVKQAVSIPVIANGDVGSLIDIHRIKAQTNCDGIMIGRSALENPWIFSRLDREYVPFELMKTTIFEHLKRNIDFLGLEQGLIRFRKHILHYLKKNEIPRDLRMTLLTTLDVDQFKSIVNDLISSQLP